MTPFTDSDAIAVLTSYAKAHGLRRSVTSRSSARRDARWRCGVQHALPGRSAGSGPDLQGAPDVRAADHLDFYTALDNKQVDAAVVFTTDPPLKTGKYTVLKDTKFIFGFQNVGMVVKKSVATAEGSAFTSTINAVSTLLTQKAIIALNSAVEVDKKSPRPSPRRS